MPDRYGDTDASDPVPDQLWMAEQRRLGIEACDLCDDNGKRADLTTCNHHDYSSERVRGMEQLRKAMGWT